ncbi:MAG: hypothetical protein IKB86_03235 [Clostridia bacterium]|nr:hypothetical protein [Clostridia bacterium]
MKKLSLLFLTVIIAVSFVACRNTQSNPYELPSGTYYMVGEFEEMMTPYLYLNFDDYTFLMGAGVLLSYAEIGSFVVKENKITATSQSTVFVFEIKNNNTLILIDNGDNEYFKMPNNSEYVLRES